jgi:hypothetical protein
VTSRNVLSNVLFAAAVILAAAPGAPAGAAPPPAAAGSGGATQAGHSGLYDQASLEALWEQAGGSHSTAVNAACHGMQESSGNRDASSPNPDGGTNWGLWQLDTRGVGAGYSVAQLEDPLMNARITVAATRNGTNWAQWATPGC